MFHDYQADNYLILLCLHLMNSFLQLELIMEATLLVLEYVVSTTCVPIDTSALDTISWFDSISFQEIHE